MVQVRGISHLRGAGVLIVYGLWQSAIKDRENFLLVSCGGVLQFNYWELLSNKIQRWEDIGLQR